MECNVCNQVWACAGRDTVSVHNANIHVKLASGTYILQKNKARFIEYKVSSLCPLCGNELEDLVHFMLACEKLHEMRHPLVVKLQIEVARDSSLVDTVWQLRYGPADPW